jgi:hypothetical protein
MNYHTNGPCLRLPRRCWHACSSELHALLHARYSSGENFANRRRGEQTSRKLQTVRELRETRCGTAKIDRGRERTWMPPTDELQDEVLGRAREFHLHHPTEQ